MSSGLLAFELSLNYFIVLVGCIFAYDLVTPYQQTYFN